MLDTKVLCGWAGPEAAQEAWDAVGSQFDLFSIDGVVRGGSAGQRVVLWDFARKVNGGRDLPNVPQLIGDCVAVGLKNAVDYLACMEILRLGEHEEFHPCFAPYFYGISRHQIGRDRLGRGDGSLGSWAALGVQQFGVLRADTPRCPQYSANIARSWGNSGPPAEFITVSKPHPVKSAGRIRSWVEARDAMFNGYPLTIASNRGFAMQLVNDDNKSWFTGQDTWPHQMALIGYDETGKRPGAFRLNQWGPDAHGPQLDGPAGGGWQDTDSLDRELRDPGVECFAYSQFDGFPAQKLDFDVV